MTRVVVCAYCPLFHLWIAAHVEVALLVRRVVPVHPYSRSLTAGLSKALEVGSCVMSLSRAASLSRSPPALTCSLFLQFGNNDDP